MNDLLTLFVLFFVKHFICDYPLQSFSYQYLNKGKYGHLGGIIHSLIHMVGTYLVLFTFVGHTTALLWGLFDFVVHYHIDYFKVNINKKFNWTSTNSEHFWVLLGYDQLLHNLTYLYIISNVV
jgi:hypothetical protein